MAFPTAIVQVVVKGVFELLKKFGTPLAAYFAGRKAAQTSQLKVIHEQAKEAARLRDGVARADDADLDSVLND